MNGASFAYVALAAVAALWLWVAAAFRVVYRPRRPREGAMTTELRAEPPAIVNLLTHDWTVTPSAPAATVLDLARRGVVEIVQVSPERDLVQLKRAPREVADLLPFERQVFEHLRRAVEKDARRRGLAQRRFPPAVLAGLGVTAGVLVLWLVIAVATTKDAEPGTGPKLWAVLVAIGVVGFAVLTVTRFDRDRQRDTDTGLAAASHWLGVRRGYAEVGNYDELPPAAVILYERHLAYAASMDAAARAVARLPLSSEDDRRGWSPHGGRWRQVEVDYPTRRIGWGIGPGRAIVTGLLWLGTLAIPIYVLTRVGTSL